MLTINSIKKGIVIDHIRSGLGMNIFKYLELDKADFRVALIINAASDKFGRKDIIKIENQLEIDYKILGLLDPTITINIIEDENIVRKVKLELPERVERIIQCKNPRCITSQEKYVNHQVYLCNRELAQYRCIYCDEMATIAEI